MKGQQGHRTQTAPADVARLVADGLVQGAYEIVVDDISHQVHAGPAGSVIALYPQLPSRAVDRHACPSWRLDRLTIDDVLDAPTRSARRGKPTPGTFSAPKRFQTSCL
jgi:hypothetical protein